VHKNNYLFGILLDWLTYFQLAVLAFEESVENRANQLNPNNDEYKGDNEEE